MKGPKSSSRWSLISQENCLSGLEGEPGKYPGATGDFRDKSLPIRRHLDCSSAQRQERAGMEDTGMCFPNSSSGEWLPGEYAYLLRTVWSTVKLARRAVNEHATVLSSLRTTIAIRMRTTGCHTVQWVPSVFASALTCQSAFPFRWHFTNK